MSRQLSNQVLAQLFGQNSDDPFLMLMTLSHSSFATLRLVDNTVDVTSRGNVFSAFPFKFVLPVDDGEGRRNVTVILDNVSLELIDELRTVTDPIDVTMEMVLASSPDTVEIEVGELKLGNINYDANQIKADLYLDDFLNTELPSEKYVPSLYPGIYQ